LQKSRSQSRLLLRRKKKKFQPTRRLTHLKYGTLLQAYGILAKKLFLFKNTLTLLQRTYHSLRLRKSFLRRSYFKPYFNKFFKNFFLTKGERSFSPLSLRSVLFYNTYTFRGGASRSFRSRYYFFNGDNSPLLAMRKARGIYSFFLQKKVLRNTQYKK
jgi:hypothetical protein